MQAVALSCITRRWAAPLALGVAIGAGSVHFSYAQQQPIKRTPLIKTDLTNVEGKEVLMTVIEAASGAAFPRHFHHGDEFIYVIDGALELAVAGKGEAAPKTGELVHVLREQAQVVRLSARQNS